MKRNPRREGKRNVGIAEKSNEMVEAIPHAAPSSGAERMVVSTADGVPIALSGFIAF